MKPNSQRDGIRREGIWEVIRGLMDGISDHIKQASEGNLPLHYVRTIDRAIYDPESGPSPDAESAITLILKLLFISHPVYDTLL